MILQQIRDRLDMLYRTDELRDSLSISTWHTMEGEHIAFHFTQEDDKYARISTNRNFSDYMEWIINDPAKAAQMIDRAAGMYAVQWDPKKYVLFIRFRRNEMTIAQAVMRLQQAVYLVGSLMY